MKKIRLRYLDTSRARPSNHFGKPLCLEAVSKSVRAAFGMLSSEIQRGATRRESLRGSLRLTLNSLYGKFGARGDDHLHVYSDTDASYSTSFEGKFEPRSLRLYKLEPAS